MGKFQLGTAYGKIHVLEWLSAVTFLFGTYSATKIWHLFTVPFHISLLLVIDSEKYFAFLAPRFDESRNARAVESVWRLNFYCTFSW